MSSFPKVNTTPVRWVYIFQYFIINLTIENKQYIKEFPCWAVWRHESEWVVVLQPAPDGEQFGEEEVSDHVELGPAADREEEEEGQDEKEDEQEAEPDPDLQVTGAIKTGEDSLHRKDSFKYWQV